jgi:spore maturation protein A
MLQMIWLGMLGLSIVCGLIQGRLDAVAQAVTDSAKLGFEITLGLVGIMSLWLGIMAIAKESGLLDGCAHFLKPILKRLLL